MKRTLRTLTLAALAACLLTVTALADSGPKPMLTVKVVNAPEELYYLDLLEADRADVQPYDNNRREDEDQPLDPALVESLLAAVPEGWHACTPPTAAPSGATFWERLPVRTSGSIPSATWACRTPTASSSPDRTANPGSPRFWGGPCSSLPSPWTMRRRP